MQDNEPAAPDPYLDRNAAAEAITANCFPVSARKLRDWSEPVTVTVAGRACAPRSEWLAEARRRLNEALFRGGDGQSEVARRMANARAAHARAVSRSTHGEREFGGRPVTADPTGEDGARI